eukprot:TRINITY_DN883_c0_g1_i1.p1 TRINITY_DN883_c0_g1~~TRINITY_DN883_c0_g1_i1.p1  ORF type:complete len:123 (+),score=37.06 TRINITY_DN883_c0_g1_i1:82-450(+)
MADNSDKMDDVALEGDDDSQKGNMDSEYVKLISAEGHEFFLNKQAALVSGTIKSMLTTPGAFMEQDLGEITFREIPTKILEKVIQYFYYRLKYSNSAVEIPEFPIEAETALELLMAANFLDT